MQSDSFIETARSWLGTRYAHQGRRKKTRENRGGVDCLGLLIGIARERNIMARDGLPLAFHDTLSYSRQPEGAQLKATLETLLDPMSPEENFSEGEILLFHFENNPQHLGLLASQSFGGLFYPSVIHAYAPARKVVEHLLNPEWQRRIVGRYRLPNRTLPQ